MKMLSKKYDTGRFLLPRTYFQIKNGVRGGAVFFESEPINVSTYLIGRKNGTADRNGIFEHLRSGEITHEFVRRHVSGRADPFVG